MNSVELRTHLLNMISSFFAENPINIMNKYASMGTVVVDAIMSQYMVRADYYEENAIATMDGYLRKGTLVW